MKLESQKILDHVICVCRVMCVFVCVSLYFVVLNIQRHFSINVIKGNDEKCKWQAKKKLVLHTYKR